MLISWIQYYENMGEAEAQRAPSSTAFPVCCVQERAAACLSAPHSGHTPISWCQTPFPSPPAVSQMFLVRISVSEAATQRCWQLPNGENGDSLCFCKAQKGSLVFDDRCYTNMALLWVAMPLTAQADYSETWMKKIVPCGLSQGYQVTALKERPEVCPQTFVSGIQELRGENSGNKTPCFYAKATEMVASGEGLSSISFLEEPLILLLAQNFWLCYSLSCLRVCLSARRSVFPLSGSLQM